MRNALHHETEKALSEVRIDEQLGMLVKEAGLNVRTDCIARLPELLLQPLRQHLDRAVPLTFEKRWMEH